MRLAILALAALCTLPLAAQQQTDFLEDLNDFRDLRHMLPEALNRQGLALLDERDRTLAELRSPAAVERRQEYVRSSMLDMLGPFPARTPLNPRTTGRIERDGFVIEKILFESRPGFVVTANLYLPSQGEGPFPAVLYPLGHEPGGKAYPVWQQMLSELARRGYVALTWDPLGQGERSQFWDPDLGDSKLGSSTVEHTILGLQCLLLGDNIAQHTVWDGIRALDYLVSRPEVDPERIAVTGNSGGGTHTAYLAALDDRFAVAAPSCYLTSYRRLLTTIGPQDAEQCLLPFLRRGLDHPDFVIAAGGKPYHILSAIRDFFSILGARSTYAETVRHYQTLGREEQIGMTEADDGHGYSAPRRAAAYGWFDRWLRNETAAEEEKRIEPLKAHELWVTPTGQVADLAGGRDVHAFNQERLERLRAARRPPTDLDALAAIVRERTRYTPPTADLHIERFGEIERDGYRIEKLTFAPEQGVRVPALLFAPAGGPAQKPATLWIDAAGKSAAASPGGEIEELVRQGRIVLAVDLRGWGETSPISIRTGSSFERWFGAYDAVMTALLIDRPLVGQRMADIVAALNLLASRGDVDAARIEAVGLGAASVPLLHAAILDERIRSAELRGMLVSYEAVVESRLHREVFESLIRGVLADYDLPDLVRAAGERVSLKDPVDPLGRRVM